MQKQITELTDQELGQLLINTTVQRGLMENQLQPLIAELLRRQQVQTPPAPTHNAIKLPKLKQIVLPQ